ncbi:hypothetical protein ACC760_38655, partial [Rhizobium ruizarguesonis]
MFAAGDQIVFLKNDGSLGVKNGMLAKVIEAALRRIVVVVPIGNEVFDRLRLEVKPPDLPMGTIGIDRFADVAARQ